MSDNSTRDVDVFTEAMNLGPVERAAFLDRACSGAVELRQRVESLLQVHERAEGFMVPPKPVLPEGGEDMEAVGERPGDRIGRYKLLQQIGEGGCGVVFMAEQEEPIRRRVALKIIKPGMDTKSVMARFEAERQALAMMDHPNIAKVFDAGATASGRPYFVMELVKGVRITDYCDQATLPPKERLRLFILVCRAIQHAHQKGIIHRDIKPSNILVTTNLEGSAQPMVIDFGIAKATTNQKLTDKTVFTAFEMLVGTPAYMSPEQAALSSIDVDTRSDIYSLGILLYELITGSTPFDGGALLKAGLDEIRRVIREKEPERPSTRLSSMTAADLTATALLRRSQPPALVRSIQGDLDWIVMKTLEKDRTRRYDTANGLALDVERYLANEPVFARPPSRLYKIEKLVFRNKLLFGSAGSFVVLLVVGLIVVTASLGRERKTRLKAQTEEAKSLQVIQFFKDMLEGVGPSVAKGKSTDMLREILDRTADRIGSEIGTQPEVETELRSLIGRLYLEIGIYDRADQMHRAALALNRRLFGPRSPEAAAALSDLGLTLWKEGNLAQSQNFLAEGLAIRREAFGDVHEAVAESLSSLSDVFRRQGKVDRAMKLTKEALATRRKLFGDESLAVADSLRSRCILLGDEGKRGESEVVARQVLALRRRLLGPEDPLVAKSLLDLAWAVGFMNKPEEAETLEREALAMRRKLLGEEHPDVAKSLYSLGDRMRQRGKFREAESFLSDALAIQRKLLGPGHPTTLETLRCLGMTLEADGKMEDAESIHRESIMLWKQKAGNEAPQVCTEISGLIRLIMARKQFGKAEQMLNDALTRKLIQLPGSAELLATRAELLGRQGRWEEALADATRALEYQPGNHERYHRVAALLAITHNQTAYEDLCRRIQSTFADASDVYVCDRMAKDCLLLPWPAIDLTLIDRLAETAVQSGQNTPGFAFFEVCKGLCEYRQGHLPEAVSWSRKTLAHDKGYAAGQASAVLAMAYWKQGDVQAATKALAQGDVFAPKEFPAQAVAGDDGLWLGWIFARTSLDEAKALVATGNN